MNNKKFSGIIIPVIIIVIIVSIRINLILASVEHMSVRSKQRHAQILKVSSLDHLLSYVIFVTEYRNYIENYYGWYECARDDKRGMPALL